MIENEHILIFPWFLQEFTIHKFYVDRNKWDLETQIRKYWHLIPEFSTDEKLRRFNQVEDWKTSLMD